MTDRYFHTVDKVEVLYPGGAPAPLPANVVVLPPENVFWTEIAAEDELTFDGSGIPNGTQAKVISQNLLLFQAAEAAGLTKGKIISALLSDAAVIPPRYPISML